MKISGGDWGCAFVAREIARNVAQVVAQMIMINKRTILGVSPIKRDDNNTK